MNNVDYDKEKFDADEYGNLHPKGMNHTCRAPDHVREEIEQDVEIMDRYGLLDDGDYEIDRRLGEDAPDKDHIERNPFQVAFIDVFDADPSSQTEIHRPHRSR